MFLTFTVERHVSVSPTKLFNPFYLSTICIGHTVIVGVLKLLYACLFGSKHLFEKSVQLSLFARVMFFATLFLGLGAALASLIGTSFASTTLGLIPTRRQTPRSTASAAFGLGAALASALGRTFASAAFFTSTS